MSAHSTAPTDQPDIAFSVVCPTYNSTAYLPRTLDSLAAQSLPPREVIFCDDGSTDDTCALIEAASPRLAERGTRVRLLRLAHGGPGAARNSGVAAAETDWIAFLDADDAWDAHKLRKAAQAIASHPEINFVIHWEQYERLSGEVSWLENGTRLKGHVDIPRTLYAANALSTSASVVHKSLFTRHGGFDVSLPPYEDYDLWLRFSPDLRLAVIEEALGSYVETPTSISSWPYWRRYPRMMRLLWRHRHKGGAALTAKRLLRTSISRQWLATLRNLLRPVPRHD